MTEEKMLEQPEALRAPVLPLDEDLDNIGNLKSYQAKPNRAASGVLPEDDPYWTFGTPPETWGSTVRRPQANQVAVASRKPMLACKRCGVRVEKKRSHGNGKVPCPSCSGWMQLTRD